MRIVTCIYVLVFLSLISYPQDIKKVVQSNNNNTITEEFFVLKSDKSVKHGNYVKYSTLHPGEKYFREYGSFNHNIRNGVWLYFNSNHIKNPLNIIGEYDDDKRTGEWAYFYEPEIKDTNILNLLTFNKLTDIISTKKELQITIDTSGLKLAALGKFDQDHKVGEWKYYSRDGDLVRIFDFTNKKEIFSSLNDSINPLLPGGFSTFQEQLTQSLLENAGEIKSVPASTLSFEIIINGGDMYINNLTPLNENHLAAYIEDAIKKMPRYWVDYDPGFEKCTLIVSFIVGQKEEGSYLDFKSFKPKYNKD